ncbi:MAG: thioredoxin family protein [Chloroflexi bacterium]|nr:thioredoxin family protein [Chloroflexota bacterium]
MLERIAITLVILVALGLLGLGWRYYKVKVRQSIQPAEVMAGVPTLLYFWADYCAPCKLQQAPILDNLTTKLGDTIVVKAYDVIQHPDLARHYKVLTLPTTVVLDRAGQVVYINYGVTPQAKLEAQLL